jgi:carotenoid cleavage dioxygenase-like enzyme
MTSAFLIRPVRQDIRKTTPISQPLLKQITGFYGLIGPDIDMTSVQSLYELFTGDGIIQGVFLDKGKITFVKHLVRTDKINYEDLFGKFSKSLFITPLYVALNKVGLIPNVLGLANTALLPIEKKVYALFERDSPYEIKIDFEEKYCRKSEC